MARKAQEGSGRQEGTRPVYVDPDNLSAVTEALKPLDRVAVEMEAKWGAGRLPRLVTTETAARFGMAQAKLNAAIRACEPEEVAKRASVLIRGWQALDVEATQAGAEALPLRTIGIKHEGIGYEIVYDRGDVHKVASLSDTPERVLTLHELLTAWVAVRNRINGIGDAKRAFPGAEVTRVALGGRGDEVPF